MLRRAAKLIGFMRIFEFNHAELGALLYFSGHHVVG